MEKGVMARLRRFLSETMAELNKCTWPGKSQLFESTILVIVSIAVLASFVAVIDQISRLVIKLITGTF